MIAMKNIWSVLWGAIALFVFWGLIIFGILLLIDFAARIMPVFFPDFWDYYQGMKWLDIKR